MNKIDSLKVLGLFYLLLICCLTYLFRQNFFFQFILVLIVCIFTDLGGYIFGKIFKGPKLTKISPNKTFSGTIGGYFLSVIFILIFFQILSFFDYKMLFSKEILLLVILISTISQLGDILISYFKRNSNVKDTGNIIPGHGGLLDRVDGMIFAFPFSYVLILLDFFKKF